VLAGRPDLLPFVTALAVAVVALIALLRSHTWPGRVGFAAVLGATFALLRLAPEALLFATPSALALAVGLWFARSLAPGREPRIATYARREHGGELSEDVARYARRLTLAWAMLLFLIAGTGAALAAFAPLAVWSTFTNVVTYLVLAGCFAGEYVWRRLRFPDRQHASFLDHLRNVARR
jgi:uncharacterized membrane protein